jgi:hypothetical protein
MKNAEEMPNAGSRSERSCESGYAYLMVLFMLLAIIITSGIALENFANTGKRQREDEAIWRGNQWVRAVRSYYHKTGYYPRTADDLESGGRGVHYLRLAAYKDPMNTQNDGAWRFIYTNSAGALIGSVRFATLQQMAIVDLGLNKGPTSPGASSTDAASGNGNNSASATDSASGAPSDSSSQSSPDNSAATTPPAANSQSPSSASTYGSFLSSVAAPSGGSSQTIGDIANLKPTGPVDGPVPGGFLTGVGSTVDRSSLRVYHKGKKYQQWEFIWNPLEDQAQDLQNGINNTQGQNNNASPGQPAGQAGANPQSQTGDSGGTPAGPSGTTTPPPSQ